MSKEIKLRRIVIVTLILTVITVMVPYLNLSSPPTNPNLIADLFDGLSVTFVSLLVVCLVTFVLKKLFHRHPLIHIVTFLLLATIPIVVLASTIDGAFINQRINTNSKDYPSYNICLTCKYSKGDFIAWYDESGSGAYWGELIATEGDEIKIDDGILYINGVNRSYGLMSVFDNKIEKSFKLEKDEHFSLFYLYPRNLTENEVNLGRTKKHLIAGKVTEIVSNAPRIIKTPNITVLDRLTYEEITKHQNSYTSPEVKFLRKALNDYLSGTPNKQINKIAIEKHAEANFSYGLDSFESSYYKSKFIIIGGSDTTGGGKDLLIVFVDNPNKIFNAHVTNEGGELELRNFYSENTDLPPLPNRFTDYFAPFLNDSEHSI